MRYTNLIDDMTWSYSRIGTYHQCPYQFLQHYIYGEEEFPKFFSDYGKFMHELIADHMENGTPSDDLIMEYLTKFRQKVKGEAPSQKMFEKYFDKGSEYIGDLEQELGAFDPVAVEEKFTFSIGGKKFVCIVDMVCKDEDGNIFIVDHKSRQLKKRSGRKKPTKADEELDEYLRQLYLYSIPVKKKFGELPSKLVFNCFRNDAGSRIIVEPFDEEKFEAAKQWALDSIEQIRQEEKWDPVVEYWKCHHLCGVCNSCEFWKEDE